MQWVSSLLGLVLIIITIIDVLGGLGVVLAVIDTLGELSTRGGTYYH